MNKVFQYAVVAMVAVVCFLAVGLTNTALAQPTNADTQIYVTKTDIPYRTKTNEPKWDDYMAERCRLDVYYPTSQKDVKQKGFATVVWFHGGGLKGGNRSIPKQLLKQGFAVVPVNYRLFPKIKAPVYIDDAAASVAWVFKHIADFGGDPNKIFVSGHSAGGYLTSMVGLDKKYLAKYDIDANKIAGLIPFSGQTVTHTAVREERKVPRGKPIIDELAPLFQCRKDCPPYIMITGDREIEMWGRYEENAYMARMMKLVGHKQTTLYELDGFNHGTMVKPACDLLIKVVKELAGKRK